MAQPSEQEKQAAAEVRIGICACSPRPEYTCSIHEAIASALASARVEAERPDEVSAALAELREMFPDQRLGIEYSDDSDRNPRWLTQINTWIETGATLSEAMQKVREWWRNQNPVQSK